MVDEYRLFEKYFLYISLRLKGLFTFSQKTEGRNEVRKDKKLPNLEVKVIKERSYTYDELELMANGRWDETLFSIWKRTSIKDHVLGKDSSIYNNPSLFWRETAGHLFEFIAKLILEKEEHMTIVDSLSLIPSYDKIAEELGLLDTTLTLATKVLGQELVKELINRKSEIQDLDIDKMKKQPFWNELLELQSEYESKISKLHWERFFKKYKRHIESIAKRDKIEFDALESIIRKGNPLDLIAFSSANSSFPKSFYLIEVKATKKNASIKSLLSRAERAFITDYSDKVGILLMRFCPTSEQINLEYCEPHPS